MRRRVTIIYLLRFPNGKGYVGKTVRLRIRLLEHQRGARTGGETALFRAIRKYGWLNVKVVVVDSTTSSTKANRLEKQYIAALGTRSPRGYNETDGGDGVTNLSDEAKHRVSAARHRQFTDPVTRERFAESQRLRFSDPLERQKISAATKRGMAKISVRKKLSQAAKGNTIRRGAKLSSATRAKLRAANLGKKASAETRRKISQSLQGNKNARRRSESC